MMRFADSRVFRMKGKGPLMIKPFPNAEYIGTHGLHIGVHQGLEISDMDYILNTLDKFIHVSKIKKKTTRKSDVKIGVLESV